MFLNGKTEHFFVVMLWVCVYTHTSENSLTGNCQRFVCCLKGTELLLHISGNKNTLPVFLKLCTYLTLSYSKL